jgi:hypothetical protein
VQQILLMLMVVWGSGIVGLLVLTELEGVGNEQHLERELISW